MLFRPDAIIGGKTGTAQVMKIAEERLKAHQMAYEHRDHAWITSWAIKGDKAYVVTAMVEHGGGGSSTAGPVVRDIYKYLLRDNPNTAPSTQSVNISPAPISDLALPEAIKMLPPIELSALQPTERPIDALAN